MRGNSRWCLSLSDCVERRWFIRFLSLRIMLNFICLGTADLKCMKMGFLAFLL